MNIELWLIRMRNNNEEALFRGVCVCVCVVCDIRKHHMHERIVFMFKLIKNQHTCTNNGTFVKICFRLQALQIYRNRIWAISHEKKQQQQKIGTPTLIMFYGAFIYCIDEAFLFFYSFLTFRSAESSLTMLRWCTQGTRCESILMREWFFVFGSDDDVITTAMGSVS